MIRRALAIAAAVAGLFAAVVDRPSALDVKQLAHAIAAEEDHVTALELAAWIRDRKPRLRIIDLRAAGEFARYHVPRSEQMPIETLAAAPLDPADTIVLLSEGGAHAAQGWVLLRARGVRQVYFLRGGVGEWLHEVMHPAKPTDLTRYFGSTPRLEEEGSSGTADAVAEMRRRGC